MLCLKKLTYVTIATLTMYSYVSYADQSYQTELAVAYKKDTADTLSTRTVGLGAEIFLEPVNTEGKPLAEAAYLNKNSSVILAYHDSVTDIQNGMVDSIEFNVPTISINYITEKDAFIFGAIYQEPDGKTKPSAVNIDGQATGLSLGKYINDYSTIEIRFINGGFKYHDITTSQNTNTDTNIYTISYNTVGILEGANYYSFNLEYSLTKRETTNFANENNNELLIYGGYYFTYMTSMDMSLAFNNGDDVSSKGKTVSLGVAHFVNPQLSLEATYSIFNADDVNTEDSDSFHLIVSLRI